MKTVLFALAAATALLALACGSDSDDVAMLDEPAATVEVNTTSDAADAVPDDEAAVMAFTECMRKQGIEYKDPVMDSKGNVQRPQLVEGVQVTRAQLAEPYTACSKHLEGLTFGRERPDLTELVDNGVELAICLRDKGLDIDDPTIETFKQWRLDLRTTLDWSDSKVKEAYETCNKPEESKD